MEMKETNTPIGQQETPIANVGQESTTPTSARDFGDGFVTSAPELRHDEAITTPTHFLEDQDTLQFTNYAAEPTIPAPNTGSQRNFQLVVSAAPTSVADTTFTPGGSTAAYADIYQSNKKLNGTQRPTAIVRGSNVLCPLGASYFQSLVKGASKIESTVDNTMKTLSTLLNTKGSFREIQNWRRISDLKNVVISYFNRSIPFTDLTTGQRFFLEYKYTSETAACCMPIYAFAAASGYLKWLDDHQMQFDNSKAANLYSARIQKMLLQIFSALDKLPVIDELHFTRLQSFARLHTSSDKTGMWGVIMQQDVITDMCYWASGMDAITAGNYVWTYTNVDTAKSGVPLSFMQWVQAFLNADEDSIITWLNQYVALASSIRSNYDILLGCAMQLQLKGSVKYKYVLDFIPATGMAKLFVNIDSVEPSFDPDYKERFEYAPTGALQEDPSGTNTVYRSCLAVLPDAATDDLSYSSAFLRPVGPWHDKDSWGVSEVVSIGCFKPATEAGSSSTAGDGTFSIVLLNQASTLTSDIPATNALFVDAIFGDMYTASTFIRATDSVGASARLTGSPIIWYYGYNGPYAPVFEWVSLVTPGLRVPATGQPAAYWLIPGNDGQGLLHYLRTQAIAYTLEQMDLTNVVLYTYLTTGQADVPLMVDTSYRQSVWDTFDITLVENTFAASIENLAIQVKRKNVQMKE